MNICECMFVQNDRGESVCVRCRGDIYACDCVFSHNRKCKERQRAIDQVNRIIEMLGLSDSHELVERTLEVDRYKVLT